MPFFLLIISHLVFGFSTDTNLESRVWNNSDLYKLENEVVRHIQLKPENAYYYFLLSILKIRQHAEHPEDGALFNLASDMARHAIDLAPGEDLGYLALAHSLDSIGKSKKALLLLNGILSSGVRLGWRYYFTLARLKSTQVESKHVLGLLEQSLAIKGSVHKVVIPYIVAALQAQHSGKSLFLNLQVWNQKFPSELFKHYMAISLSNIGEYVAARDLFRQLRKVNKSKKEAVINEAIILYQHLNKPLEARKLLNQVLALKYEDKNVLENVNNHIGRIELELNRPDIALEYFAKAAQYSFHPIGYIDSVLKHLRNQNKQKHTKIFMKKMLKTLPPSGVLFAIYGEVLSEDLALHGEAIGVFEDAILLNPERPDFRNGLGLSFYRMKKYDEALESFSNAVRINPNDATALYNTGCILALKNKTKQAITALEESFSLDPDLITHAVNDNDLVNLKNDKGFRDLIERYPLSH